MRILFALMAAALLSACAYSPPPAVMNKQPVFPKVTVSYEPPLRFEVVQAPSREQQQIAADLILDRIRARHDELEHLGHRGSRRHASTHAVA